MPSSLSIVIPYRPTPDRQGHIEAACAALFAACPRTEIFWYDSRHQPFNRAASRNGAVAEHPADVMVVCDADAIIDVEPLREAITEAGDGKLHLPYTACRMLTPQGSEMAKAGYLPRGCEASVVNPHSVGGCAVLAYETWRDVGGWDERFVDWGFEDTALWAAVDTLHGTVRHEGVLGDLWHTDARRIGSPGYITGKALCDRYTDARGDKPAMRALIRERLVAA